jgi:uncharacterized HAD superfamily protein
VPLRIAFDLDGVFADMEGELARQADDLFGESLRQSSIAGAGAATDTASSGEEPPLPALRLTDRQQRELWDYVEAIDNFWETLREIEPGSVARLAALAAERRWEIIFLTRRPATAGATAQRQTQRWLQSKGFDLPSVFVVQGSRGLVAASLSLDFVVDDTVDNCLDVATDSKARAILVWRDKQDSPAAVKRLGVAVVRSVAESFELLEQTPPAGLMNRMRKMLGV